MNPLRPLPPRRLPLLATLAVAACLALLTLQVVGNPQGLAIRLLLLLYFMLACWPLSALQRNLWERAFPGWKSALCLLLSILVLTLLSNLALAVQAQAMGQGSKSLGWLTLLRGRGFDALGLALLVQVTLHSALNHAWAQQAERERALRAEQLAREAELRALRYQLQPHFLFNTLNAVSALVAAERGREARTLISRLADYLRGTLEADSRHQVPLAEELAQAADYLAIEQCRLGERLQLRQQVEPGLLGQPTPRWLLQPLLENAVQHGISRRAQGGRLDLHIRPAGKQMELELLNDPADSPSDSAGLGVGLRNVQSRLQALYPQSHSLESGVVSIGDEIRWRVVVRWPQQA